MAKKSLHKAAAGVFLTASALFFSGCSTPPKTEFSAYKQHKVHDLKIDSAILVSSQKEWYDYFRIPFEPVYESVVASALKEKLGCKGYTITFNAEWKDLQDALKDPCIQTIVVAGHGKWYGWVASDEDVYEFMIAKFMSDNCIPKKNGFFIRHTCGDYKYWLPTNHLLDNKEYATALYSLALYGAKDIIIDDKWSDEDINNPAEKNRLSYTFGTQHDAEMLAKISSIWNKYINDKGLKRKRNALGSSIVLDSAKTRGYEGIVSPLEYLLNPIPEQEK